MNSSSPLSPGCTILTAQPAHVDRAYHDLSRDMDGASVHVFLDKLQRYAAKPDRALFLAERQKRVIGFATIIDRAPPPDETDNHGVELLKTYACGTGLMVLPEFRHGHVASTLHQHWEKWSLDMGRQGIWVVTRRMAPWYQRCFSYSINGVTIRSGVTKTVMLKPLTRQPVKTPVSIPHMVGRKPETTEKAFQ